MDNIGGGKTMIHWINEKEKVGAATLYSTNLTLNAIASIPFELAYKVQVGIDGDSGEVLVKPLSKERVDRGDLPKGTLYDIALKKSYSRISATGLMSTIAEELGITLGKEPFKCQTRYDNSNGYLVISVKKGGN